MCICVYVYMCICVYMCPCSIHVLSLCVPTVNTSWAKLLIGPGKTDVSHQTLFLPLKYGHLKCSFKFFVHLHGYRDNKGQFSRENIVHHNIFISSFSDTDQNVHSSYL